MFNPQALITLLVLTALCTAGLTHASSVDLRDDKNHEPTYKNVLSSAPGENYSKDNLYLEANINLGDNKVNVSLENSNTVFAIPNPEIHAILLVGLVLSVLTYSRKNKNII